MLTKADFEESGCEYTGFSNQRVSIYHKGEYEIVYDSEEGTVDIYGLHIGYNGPCEDKAELEKIFVKLNINGSHRTEEFL